MRRHSLDDHYPCSDVEPASSSIDDRAQFSTTSAAWSISMSRSLARRFQTSAIWAGACAERISRSGLLLHVPLTEGGEAVGRVDHATSISQFLSTGARLRMLPPRSPKLNYASWTWKLEAERRIELAARASRRQQRTPAIWMPDDSR